MDKKSLSSQCRKRPSCLGMSRKLATQSIFAKTSRSYILWKTLHQSRSSSRAAFPFHDPSEKPIVPFALRAPELILGLKLDHRIDVWSFGCIAFELLTGTPLFAVASLPTTTEDETDDGHLLKMASALGPLPPALFAQWPRGQRYFNSKMQLNCTNVEDDPAPQAEVHVGRALETMFMAGKP